MYSSLAQIVVSDYINIWCSGVELNFVGFKFGIRNRNLKTQLQILSTVATLIHNLHLTSQTLSLE